MIGLVLWPSWALADVPLSAIDWLSDSFTTPFAALPAPSLENPVAATAAPSSIEVAPLEQPVSRRIGLIGPKAIGLTDTLWSGTSAEAAIGLLAAIPDDLPPSLRPLLIGLLIAEASPPEPGNLSPNAFFLARIDKLLRLGALDEAKALLALDGPSSPGAFRRWFDISLLTNDDTAACEALRNRPEIAPTYPARIFCLARTGDWAAAAVTLETAETLGILTPEEDALLAQFLDPEIVSDQPFPEPMTPLRFLLIEALGSPPPTVTLPLAFAHADLQPTRGWKARLEAGERLARAGALPPNRLLGLYTERRPSASGGVWERARAVQALIGALETSERDVAADVATTAWQEMAVSGLAPALAEIAGPKLAAMWATSEPPEDVVRLISLSSAYADMPAATDTDDAQLRFWSAVARGKDELPLATTPLAAAVSAGLTDAIPDDDVTRLQSDGRVGEAVLRSLSNMGAAIDGDPDGIARSLAGLRALGLDAAARRAALDLRYLPR